jgi:hypothetical protein
MSQKSPFPVGLFIRQPGWVLLIIMMFQIPQDSCSRVIITMFG